MKKWNTPALEELNISETAYVWGGGCSIPEYFCWHKPHHGCGDNDHDKDDSDVTEFLS